MIDQDTQKTNFNNVWCENGIVYYTISAPVDEKEAVRLDTVGEGFINTGEASFVLINIEKSKEFSSSARKAWVKFLQNPKIKRTAMFGGNVFVRTLASFVIAAAGKENIKFFGTEQEALGWLHSTSS
ncbi:MAG: STAS/SEC14 domain-containing protein [bacterium]|nr:STAS/SEC14 domain-containing protein [bacterium]